jgi:hypothetical protein
VKTGDFWLEHAWKLIRYKLGTYLEDVVNVEHEVEDVEREPGERKDDDDGDEQGVGSSLASATD